MRTHAERLVARDGYFSPESMVRRLGNSPSVAEAGWPKVDPDLLVESVVTCVVQVSGKVQTRLQVPAEISAETPLASHSSWRWPRSPKPVTSVIALGPAARA